MKFDLNRHDLRLLLSLIEDYMDYLAYSGSRKSADISNLEHKIREAIIENEKGRE